VTRPASRRGCLGLLCAAVLLALAGSGCAEEPVTKPSTPPPVDEEAQSRDAAISTINSYCLQRPHRGRRRRPSQRPRRATRAEAKRALRRLLVLASRHSAADDEANLEWRDVLTDGAHFLEERRCLQRLVPKVDRELRFFELPEPEPVEDYEEPVEDEPAYP